ncbi:sulfite exporter TauE/SafE family protein [Micromonospora purpureochromogenes]|uniref:sulfite exporter TauE/SafE family protein n=1 Tax=Micromonospora purpureochromogenes TaxID=47872 RepID=UPI0033F4EDC9
MDLTDGATLFVAATGAGAINALVGSGSLITFPTLIALGYPPILATVSNNVGLVPGMAGAVYGYRRELAGQTGLLLRLAGAAASGALIGSLLLLTLPAAVFRLVVPGLIVVACALVVLQPILARRVVTEHASSGPWLWIAVFGTGIYGGYFGAAQGVILMGILGAFVAESIQRINAVKNAIALIVNLAAAIVFVAVTTVNWVVALVIAVGSTIGGLLGSRFGRLLSPDVLRAAILLVGALAIVHLVVL